MFLNPILLAKHFILTSQYLVSLEFVSMHDWGTAALFQKIFVSSRVFSSHCIPPSSCISYSNAKQCWHVWLWPQHLPPWAKRSKYRPLTFVCLSVCLYVCCVGTSHATPKLASNSVSNGGWPRTPDSRPSRVLGLQVYSTSQAWFL